MASCSCAQDKIIGEWKLTGIEDQDTLFSRIDDKGQKWVKFLSDHTVKYGIFPDHVLKKGTWEYDKKNERLIITFDDAKEDKLEWSIKKLTRNTMIVGEDYPFIIFKKTE